MIAQSRTPAPRAQLRWASMSPLVCAGCDEATGKLGENLGSFFELLAVAAAVVVLCSAVALCWLVWQWIAVARGRRRVGLGLVVVTVMLGGAIVASLAIASARGAAAERAAAEAMPRAR